MNHRFLAKEDVNSRQIAFLVNLFDVAVALARAVLIDACLLLLVVFVLKNRALIRFAGVVVA